MAAKKQKNMTIDIEPAKVVYTSIQKSSGYNSARLVVKAGDKEFLQISYDWEGNGIPDFAMQLMEFMKSNNVETSGVWPNQEAANLEYEDAAKKKKMEKCPDCGKPMPFCTCDDGEEEDTETEDNPKEEKKEKKKKK
jgi:hypothetical protein